MSTPEVNELYKIIRGRMSDPVVVAFVKLLDIKIDEWKESMVNAPKDTIPEFQGAIKLIRELLIDLNRRPNKSEFKSGAYTGL